MKKLGLRNALACNKMHPKIFFSSYNLIFKGFYFYFFENTVNKVVDTPSVSDIKKRLNP